SSLIDPVKESFLALASALTIAPPRLPLMSCARADFVDWVTHEHFWHVVRSPIRASETIRKLLDGGDRLYVDAGPSGTMANLVIENANGAHRKPTSLFVLHPLVDEEARF